jgi:hypothetical protein
VSELPEPRGEAARAVQAIGLGVVLGTILALLGRARDRRARRATA